MLQSYGDVKWWLGQWLDFTSGEVSKRGWSGINKATQSCLQQSIVLQATLQCTACCTAVHCSVHCNALLIALHYTACCTALHCTRLQSFAHCTAVHISEAVNMSSTKQEQVQGLQQFLLLQYVYPLLRQPTKRSHSFILKTYKHVVNCTLNFIFGQLFFSSVWLRSQKSPRVKEAIARGKRVSLWTLSKCGLTQLASEVGTPLPWVELLHGVRDHERDQNPD